MKAAEKLKAIGDLLKQAFTTQEVDTVEAPAAEETPAAPIEAAPENPETTAPEMVTMEQVNSMFAAWKAEMATQFAGYKTAMDAQFEEVKKKNDRQGEAFKLQHQALENMLTVVQEFTETPAAGTDTAPANKILFQKEGKKSRTEILENLVANIKSGKPAPATN